MKYHHVEEKPNLVKRKGFNVRCHRVVLIHRILAADEIGNKVEYSWYTWTL